METSTNHETIDETYSNAAARKQPGLCCAVDYREVFSPEELGHVPEAVLDRNYGCGVPPELRTLREGLSVLDLGPGLGRDCFIAARKVGPSGLVHGLDMNDQMLCQANQYKRSVVAGLGYDNIRFLKGRFDVRIPLADCSVDVIFSNCVNNLALDKQTAYREMLRVLKPGSHLSFADVVSYDPVPEHLRANHQAWADCVAGVLSYRELADLLDETGFHGVTFRTDYLWKTGRQVLDDYFASAASLSEREREQLLGMRLYSVVVEAFKPVVDPAGDCYFRGQFALYHGPGRAFQLDGDPEHLFRAGDLKEVCEKTATLLKSSPLDAHFTVFEPEGDVKARFCGPGTGCC